MKLIKSLGWSVGLLACLIQFAYAQQTSAISGTVVDQDRSPLEGVSVTAASGATTVTDIDGRFTIAVSASEWLTFTHIKYHSTKAQARSEMQVQLEPTTTTLDEVVVVGVGYGTMRRSDLTGAISSVSAKDFRQGVITSAEQLLQGKVAGLTVTQPSGDPVQGAAMRLRGGTSLSASNSPLVVVDGIPGVDMNTVQPSEIVSIDVLKDASAAAIYGSRGANGVIIVTTNREGERRTMSYNGYVAVGNVANQLDLLSADQWRAYVRENEMSGAVDYGADTDWVGELQRTAITNFHSLSFTNGSKESGVNGAFSYLDAQGIIHNSSLGRLAGSLSGYQYGLNNRLKIEAGIHANRDQYHPIDLGIFERAYNLNPTLPVMQNGAYTQIGGTNANNPVEILHTRQDDQTRNRLLAFGKAEADLGGGLKATVNGSYEYNSQQGRFYQNADSFNGRTDKGYGRRNLGDYSNLQLESFLTYDKTFNEVHQLNALGGYSYLQNTYEGFGAERRGFDTDLFQYNNIGSGSDFRLGDVYSYKGQAKLISFFGRVNYSYDSRYMFTATLRRDGSSRFGANHKWGLFPSASVAWRLTEESFMADTRGWLDNLKLRFGYGVTGNQDGIGEYKSLSLMGTGGGAYYDQASDTWKQSYGIVQNPNPELRWESTAQTNLGLDIAFLGRFNATFDAYIKKTSDLLYTYNVPQPPYLYDKMLANVGDLTNRGIELTLGANIVRKDRFTWNANVVMARNMQKVDRLSNELYQTEAVPSGNLHGLTGMSGVYTQLLKEGYAVGTFWGPKFLGIDEEGKFILETGEDGEVIQQYLGNAQPKMMLGFAMDMTYRNFDFNVAANGMFGQKILNAQAMNISYPGRMPGYNVLDSWVGTTITEGPVFSDYWIEDGSFLRLQSASLGYTLPVNPTWFSRARIYVTGENLFTITGYKGLDPEVNFSGLASPGIDKSLGEGDNYYYPRARTFTFGINLSF